ncbi:hypothetical protein JHK87_043540 [Glycine soja]|nr:hypothetical protein JHK87_043540 [Glycine soja]
MKDVNSNESNIGEESHSFDRQGSLEFSITLPFLVHLLTLLRCVLSQSLPRGRSKFSSIKLLIPPGIEPNEVDDSTVLPGSNITVGPYTGDS